MAFVDSIMMTLIKLKSNSILTGSYILPLTMVLYSLQPILFFKAISFNGIGITNALWNSISTIVIAILGLLIFGEEISLRNWVGIFLCTVGIILVEI